MPKPCSAHKSTITGFIMYLKGYTVGSRHAMYVYMTPHIPVHSLETQTVDLGHLNTQAHVLYSTAASAARTGSTQLQYFCSHV
jgi:hypothetical protein